MSNFNPGPPPGHIPPGGMGGFGNRPGPMPSDAMPQGMSTAAKTPQKKAGSKNKESGKNVHRKVLSTQRIAAVGLALVAALAAYSLLSVPEERTFVVKTSTAIPAASVVEPDMIYTIPLPAEAVEEGAITGATSEEAFEKIFELIGNGRARQYIPVGRQLHEDDFSPEGLLREPLRPDERLISIEASVAGGVGGQLMPGDRVDIIAFANVSFGNDGEIRLGPTGEELPPRAEGTVSRTIVTDVELVSILPAEQFFDNAAQQQFGGAGDEKSPNELIPQRPVPGIYIIRVSAEEAKILAVASNEATLVLAFRGADAQDQTSAINPITLEDILGLPGNTILQGPAQINLDIDEAFGPVPDQSNE